jgi:hypothetical protein
MEKLIEIKFYPLDGIKRITKALKEIHWHQHY